MPGLNVKSPMSNEGILPILIKIRHISIVWHSAPAAALLEGRSILVQMDALHRQFVLGIRFFGFIRVADGDDALCFQVAGGIQ
jgi:hypothetical protein